MPRPKKEKPNHGQYFEVKVAVGHKPDGTVLRKGFYSIVSREDAKRQGEEYRVQQGVSAQLGIGFVERRQTFSTWANTWLETVKRGMVKDVTFQTTYKAKVDKYLSPVFGASYMDTIRQIDIQRFFTAHTHLSESTLKKLRSTLWGIFDLAVENNICARNPVTRIKLLSAQSKVVRPVLNELEASKLGAYCTSNAQVDILLLLHVGMRRGELLGLEWKHIDTAARIVHIIQSISQAAHGTEVADPKSSAGIRDIPISNELATYLEGHASDGYIVKGTDGGYMSLSGYTKNYNLRMKRICQELQIPFVTPHELRHTCGTLLRQSGADVYTIQKVLGHSDIGITTKIYVHNDLAVLRERMGL